MECPVIYPGFGVNVCSPNVYCTLQAVTMQQTGSGRSLMCFLTLEFAFDSAPGTVITRLIAVCNVRV